MGKSITFDNEMPYKIVKTISDVTGNLFWQKMYARDRHGTISTRIQGSASENRKYNAKNGAKKPTKNRKTDSKQPKDAFFVVLILLKPAFS